MKTLNKAVARYNGISLIVRILIGLIIGAVLALVAPGAGGAFLSSKPQNCILCKYSFRGEKIKVHKNWKTREKNAWKYFLFWAVCAIMTLVLGKKTENCTHEAYSIKRSVIIL